MVRVLRHGFLGLVSATLLAWGCSSASSDPSEPSDAGAMSDDAAAAPRPEDGSTAPVPADAASPGDAGAEAPKDAEAGAADAEAGAPDPTAPLYDPDVVPKFELTFDDAARAVLSSTADADRKTWVHASFTYGGVTFVDVGLRRKGESTFRALPGKAAFKVRFDKYVAGQKLFGLSEITLNNMVSDPTFVAERLAYHVFLSAGLPAPRANAAEVVLNGVSWGLYANIETPNKDLNKRLFGANAQTLYEVNWGSEWTSGNEDGFEIEVGTATKPDVAALFTAVEGAQSATLLADVAAVLDTNEWLGFSATEAVVGHYDGYGFGLWGSHNYFMAGDTTGKLRLLPWSTDLTFSDREVTAPAVAVNAAEPKGASTGPTLLVRCKASAPCWATYRQRVGQILTTYESLGLVALAKKWNTQVDPYVKADTKREASLDYYTSETTALHAWLAARPAVVRAQLGL